MPAMFPDYPKVGLSPVLAGSKNQAATFIIRKVAEINKLKPEGLAKPVIGLMARKKEVIPVQIYNQSGLVPVAPERKNTLAGLRINRVV